MRVFFILAFLIRALPVGIADEGVPQTSLEQLGHIARILDLHPRFLSNNTLFGMNAPQLLARASSLWQELGRTDWNPPTISRIAVKYFAVPAGANRRAINAFRDRVILPNLSRFPLHQFRSFALDYATLAARPDSEKWLGEWLNFAPLIYDAEGQPTIEKLRDLRVRINEFWQPERRAELDSLYRDTLPNHLIPLVRNSSLTSLQEALVRRADLNQALNPLQGQGKIHSRTLHLEEVPPWVALLRGGVGFDCSSRSVPFHVLAPGVKTYFLRHGSPEGADILGYAVVAPVRIGTNTYPYVLTINGLRLGIEDSRAALHGIAADWKASELVLSDFKSNPHVVNFGPIRSAMNSGNSRPVSVTLSPEWLRIDSETIDERYPNFYQAEKISNARLAPISSLTAQLESAPDAIAISSSPSPYARHSELPLSERPAAVRAVLLLELAESETKIEMHYEDRRGNMKVRFVPDEKSIRANLSLQRELHLTDEQGKAARELSWIRTRVHYKKNDPEMLRSLAAHYPALRSMGLGGLDLPTSLDTQAKMLTALRQYQPAVETEDAWNRIYQELSGKLSREIDHAIEEENFDRLSELFHAGYELPLIHERVQAARAHPRRGIRIVAEQTVHRNRSTLGWWATLPVALCRLLLAQFGTW